MVRVIRARSIVVLALVALVMPFATRAAPLEAADNVVELVDAKKMPASADTVTLVPEPIEEATTADDEPTAEFAAPTSEEATTSDDDEPTAEFAAPTSEEATTSDDDEQAATTSEEDETDRVKRGYSGGYLRSGLDLDVGYGNVGYGSGLGLSRGVIGKGYGYGGLGLSRGVIGKGYGYGGLGLTRGVVGTGLGLGIDSGLVTGGLAISGPIRVPAHTGGTGRTTLLKSYRSTTVPTYRTGVTYVPQRYHVTGRKDITVPYYRRITHTVRNLGPGNAHVRRVQTAVRHEGVSGGQRLLNQHVGSGVVPTVAVKGLGVSRLGLKTGYGLRSGLRRVGGYGVKRVNVW